MNCQSRLEPKWLVHLSREMAEQGEALCSVRFSILCLGFCEGAVVVVVVVVFVCCFLLSGFFQQKFLRV